MGVYPGRRPMFHETFQGKEFIEKSRELKRHLAGMRYKGDIETALIGARGAADVAGIRGASLRGVQKASDVAAGERLTEQIAGQKDVAGIRGRWGYETAEIPGQLDKYFEHYGGRGTEPPAGDLGEALADVLGGQTLRQAPEEGVLAAPKRKRKFPRPGATPLEELEDLDTLMNR